MDWIMNFSLTKIVTTQFLKTVAQLLFPSVGEDSSYQTALFVPQIFLIFQRRIPCSCGFWKSCPDQITFFNTAIINLFFKIFKTNKMKKSLRVSSHEEDWCCFFNIFCLKWLKHICKFMYFCKTEHDWYLGNNTDMGSNTPQELTRYLTFNLWAKLLWDRSTSAYVEKENVENTHSLCIVCYYPKH